MADEFFSVEECRLYIRQRVYSQPTKQWLHAAITEIQRLRERCRVLARQVAKAEHAAAQRRRKANYQGPK